MIDTARVQMRAWLDMALEVRVSVNVSLRQFRDPGFVDRLRDRLNRHGVPPGQLIVEITESTAMREAECVERRRTASAPAGCWRRRVAALGMTAVVEESRRPSSRA